MIRREGGRLLNFWGACRLAELRTVRVAGSKWLWRGQEDPGQVSCPGPAGKVREYDKYSQSAEEKERVFGRISFCRFVSHRLIIAEFCQLFLGNLRVAPRFFFAARAHKVRVGSFARYQNSVSAARLRERFRNRFAPVCLYTRRDTGKSFCDFFRD